MDNWQRLFEFNWRVCEHKMTYYLISHYAYRNLPNRGAGRESKTKLGFWAFQRWFRIENRSNIKEIKPILVPQQNIGSPKLRGRLY